MDENTIEALREVLQDMTTTIELISSGERSGAALIRFIEEMLKTIESWAVKYNVSLDDGSVAVHSTQDHHTHPTPLPYSSSDTQFQHQVAIDSLDEDQDVIGKVDMGDPSLRHNSVEGERFQQSMMSFNQEEVTHSAEEGGIERVEQQTNTPQIDQSSARIVSRKTRSQTALMQGGVTSVLDRGGKILVPQSEESLKPQEGASGDEPDGSMRDVIESPNWLPEGWITKVKTRGSSGSKDKVYIDPTTKQHFQTKRDVLAFLGTTNRKRGRPRKNESPKDDSPSHANDNTMEAGSVDESIRSSNPEVLSPTNVSPSSPAAGGDTTKRKRGRPRKVDSVKSLPLITKGESDERTTSTSQDGAILESGVKSNFEPQAPSSKSLPTINETHAIAAATAAASTIPTFTGALNSGTPLPHQPGQPSEWLVYESLASLPFPMFEHLRFVENNANKLMTNNSPPTLSPWMLGNSEGLKKPSTENRIDERKPVEGGRAEEEITTRSAAEEVQVTNALAKRPKKAARKNAS